MPSFLAACPVKPQLLARLGLCVAAAALAGSLTRLSVTADDNPAISAPSSDTSAVSTIDAGVKNASAEAISESAASQKGTDAAKPDESKQDVKYGKYNPLNQFESWVILQKGTEPAGPGGFTNTKKEGVYICRRCNAALYDSGDKFESHCGWPSFDDEIEGSVRRQRDADGVRVEITCSNCGAHLGHVFSGEQLTEKDTRHCVNSISMKFIPKGKEVPAKIKPLALRGKVE